MAHAQRRRDRFLAGLSPERAQAGVVASTVVSSRMLASIAAEFGATHVETLTGFKWLARADADLPGRRLVYAYEEAIGHCVDPEAVRDKDGISAAALACAMVSAWKSRNRCATDELDRLARRHGVHQTAALSLRVDDAAGAMTALRAGPPTDLAATAVECTDLAQLRGPRSTDALVFAGTAAEATVRMVVRPSGTEPKLKFYLEVACPPAEDVAAARAVAGARCEALLADARRIGRTLLGG
jgi:phosphomannomutase